MSPLLRMFLMYCFPAGFPSKSTGVTWIISSYSLLLMTSTDMLLTEFQIFHLPSNTIPSFQVQSRFERKMDHCVFFVR